MVANRNLKKNCFSRLEALNKRLNHAWLRFDTFMTHENQIPTLSVSLNRKPSCYLGLQNSVTLMGNKLKSILIINK